MVRLVPLNIDFYFADHSEAGLPCGFFLLFTFLVYLCYAVLSVPCSLGKG